MGELGLRSLTGSGLKEVDLGEGVYGDRSLHYFAYSYSRAFEVLWHEASAGPDALEYPMLFARRYSMELWLKAVIKAVSPGAKPLRGHGLKQPGRPRHAAQHPHGGRGLDALGDGAL